MNSSSLKRTKGLKKSFSMDNDELCNECENEFVFDSCNKCANGVCSHKDCCITFPHYYGKLYILCNSCVSSIEKKLKVYIDDDKIKLIKKKAETKRRQISLEK